MSVSGTILVTGFEPFGGSDVNPSERAASALASREGFATGVLPCVDGACDEAVLALIEEHTPSVVIALGEHGRETGLAFERLALNRADYRIADNAGNRRRSVLAEGAPVAYETTLDVRAMAEASMSAGVPARVSRDAGAFLCNQVYFTLLHARATGRIGCPALFVHVPRLPEQVAKRGNPGGSMGTDVVVRGLLAALSTLTHPA